MSENSPPMKEFRAGTVVAAIWAERRMASRLHVHFSSRCTPGVCTVNEPQTIANEFDGPPFAASPPAQPPNTRVDLARLADPRASTENAAVFAQSLAGKAVDTQLRTLR